MLVVFLLTHAIPLCMLQTPGTAKKHNRTKNTYNAMMINPDGRQSEQLTDEAPGTIETAAEESSCKSPTRTATLHAYRTATPSHRYHHTDSARSSPESSQPMQPSARFRRAEPLNNTDTAHIIVYTYIYIYTIACVAHARSKKQKHGTAKGDTAQDLPTSSGHNPA